VDYSEAPEVKELAEHARRVGNEMYPKIVALLADDTSKLPQHFVIGFKRRTWRGMPGVTLRHEDSPQCRLGCKEPRRP